MRWNGATSPPCTASARTRSSPRPTSARAIGLLEGLDILVVQDLFLTRTAELADVVLPAAAAWAEGEGTVTNSERRVQRVRKAVDPPEGARDDLAIIFDIARRMGHDWGEPDAERVWDEVRSLSPVHAGMTYQRLEELGGIQWPCYDEDHPGELFLHSRLWEDPVPGNRVPFVPVDHDPPVDKLDRRIPDPADDRPSARLLQHRRPDRGLYVAAPPGRVARHLARGRRALRPRRRRASSASISRRGQVEVPVRIDPSLRPGLTFMTLHFQDDVATNLLTIDATDPKSGTAEFKATAIRIEKLGEAVRPEDRRAASGTVPPLHSTRWTCTSSGRSRPPPSVRRSTACSASRSPGGSAGRGGRASTVTPLVAGMRSDSQRPCCCRRSTRSRTASAGSASPRLNYISRRLTVPPAEAYGVATFYALSRRTPRPPVVAHVCDDIACRLAGAEAICDDLGRAVGPEGEAARDGQRRLAAIARASGCATWRRPRWSRPPASRPA